MNIHMKRFQNSRRRRTSKRTLYSFSNQRRLTKNKCKQDKVSQSSLLSLLNFVVIRSTNLTHISPIDKVNNFEPEDMTSTAFEVSLCWYKMVSGIRKQLGARTSPLFSEYFCPSSVLHTINFSAAAIFF
ncbi:hypothetical protein J6590_086998 [Homalodisca vitripennis]|nr:hypothetical protein J6590_086998 [Homalodisca vitripennis]